MKTKIETTTGRYRTADRKAEIEWELKPTIGGPEFSAQGSYCGAAGQCIDEIAAAYPDDAMVQRVAAVWRAWHLNGMQAGTKLQQHCLEGHKTEANADERRRDHYGWAVKTLEAAGLLEVEVEPGSCEVPLGGWARHRDTGKPLYRYGERWLCWPLPDEVVREIRSWAVGPARPLELDQADGFLKRHELQISIKRGDKVVDWSPSGHHYRCTLAGHGRITFDYWGSANDAEARRQPTTCDILACLSSDSQAPDDVDEAIREFGIEDRRKAALVVAFGRKLRDFFTDAELQELQAIR